MNLEKCTFNSISKEQKEELKQYKKRNHATQDNFGFLARITNGDPIQIKNYSHKSFYEKVASKYEDVFFWVEQNIYIIPTDSGVYKLQEDIIN